MIVNFNQLFLVQNGAITPKVLIHINGISFGPGVSFGSGVSFGGVDFSQLIGKNFEVEKAGDVHVIKGYYN